MYIKKNVHGLLRPQSLTFHLMYKYTIAAMASPPYSISKRKTFKI